MGCAGLVCTGGVDHGLAGWDPRAKTPRVFAKKDFRPVFDMIALEASEGRASPQLLLGGLKQQNAEVGAFNPNLCWTPAK